MLKTLTILKNLLWTPLTSTQIGIKSLIFSFGLLVFITPMTMMAESVQWTIAVVLYSVMLPIIGIAGGLVGLIYKDLRSERSEIRDSLRKAISEITSIPKKLLSLVLPHQNHLTAPLPDLPHEILAMIIDKAVPSSPSTSSFDLSLVSKIWHHSFYTVLKNRQIKGRDAIYPLVDNQAEEIAYLITNKDNILEQIKDASLGLTMERAFKRLEQVSQEDTEFGFYAREAVLNLINKNIIYLRMMRRPELNDLYIPAETSLSNTTHSKYDPTGIHINPYLNEPPFVTCQIKTYKKLLCSNSHLTRWPHEILLDDRMEIKHFFSILEAIDLSNNYLKALPIAFNELPKLQQLCVTGNVLSDIAEPLSTKLCSSEWLSLSKKEVLELQKSESKSVSKLEI